MIIKEEKIVGVILFLYTFTYSLMQIDYSSQISIFSKINIGTVYILYAAFIIKCMSNIRKKNLNKKNLLLILFCIMSFVSSLYGNNHDMFILAILLYIINNTNGKKYLNILFVSQLISIIIINISCYLGFTSNIIVYSNGIKKQSIGFVHANTFAFSVLNCQLLYYAKNINKRKTGLLTTIAIILINILIYYITHSRTVLLLGILSAVFVFVYDREFIQKYFKRIISFFMNSFVKIILPIILVVFIYIIINFDKSNQMFNSLNVLLSKRILLLSEALKIYPLNLFGQKVNIVSSSLINVSSSTAVVVDNAIIYSLLSYGIISTVLMIILYAKGIKKVIKDKNYIILMCIIMFIFTIFTEKYFIRLANNFTLLIMVYDSIWRVGKLNDKQRNDKKLSN